VFFKGIPLENKMRKNGLLFPFFIKKTQSLTIIRFYAVYIRFIALLVGTKLTEIGLQSIFANHRAGL
jgi:hypothetical protein